MLMLLLEHLFALQALVEAVLLLLLLEKFEQHLHSVVFVEVLDFLLIEVREVEIRGQIRNEGLILALLPRVGRLEVVLLVARGASHAILRSFLHASPVPHGVLFC